MPPLQSILAKLPDAKQSGKGYIVRCPAHEDRKASLSISEGEDGRTLLHCFAGCTHQAVLEAIGLQPSDLFSSEGKASATSPKSKTKVQEFATSADALAVYERQLGGKASRVWVYKDILGETVGMIARWDKPNGKEIRPISVRGNRWVLEAMSSPRPLYALEEARKAKCVIVVEGEKAADAARSLGFVATTSAGGSQAAKQTDWQPLIGKEIWILPDNDAPGRKYAETVTAILRELGHGSTIKTIQLPNLPNKGDIVDWIQNHGDAAEPAGMRQEIEDLAKAVAPTPMSNNPNNQDSDTTSIRKLETTNLGELKMEPVRWLTPDFIPLGILSLWAGHGGGGKSTLLSHVIACVTTGRNAFGLNYPEQKPQNVLLFNLEDATVQVIVPRLVAAGADLNRVELIRGSRDDKGKMHAFSLSDIESLEERHKEKPFSLLVIDPISGPIALAGAKDNLETDVRPLLEGVAQFAESYNVAVIGVKHLAKGERESAAMRTLGSVAYTSVPRIVLSLVNDPQDENYRIIARSKCNLPIQNKNGIRFSTENPPEALAMVKHSNPDLNDVDAQLMADQLSRCIGFETWTGDIDRLMNSQPGSQPGKNSSIPKDEAAKFLRSFLEAGSKPSNECISEGNKKLGTSFQSDWWRKVLKENLGGSVSKSGSSWMWKLAESNQDNESPMPLL